MELPRESWAGAVQTVTLGATAAEGGTRGHTVTVGGQQSLPFMHFEHEMAHRPRVAVEVANFSPDDWSPLLAQAWGDVMQDPATWAHAAEQAGAELIVLLLRAAGPDGKPTTAQQAVAATKAVLGATSVPLLVYGPGQADLDNE